MKTCLLYGHNGLDLCVTFNAIPFYERLGFKVFFSEKLHDADLLVVFRASDKKIDLSPFNYSQIHVFDYGGWDYDSFIRSIDLSITYIFCTSPIKRQRLIDNLGVSEDHTFVSLPPVEINLWTKNNPKTIIYDWVHIGNFKPIDGIDTVKEMFYKSISVLNAHVWGNGWKLIDENLYHGKASLLKVAKIYSQSRFALGLMYPFQRDVTFSSRFWQAPLNGCFVISERGAYTKIVPGIIETDFSLNDIENKIKICESRNTLINKSKAFWTEQNEITLVNVMKSLNRIENKPFSLDKYATYILNLFQNKLRILYQK